MNVLQILNSHNVDYIESGRNVAKGNVNIQCPWCGADDRSQHLGINLESGMWGCWRNSAHRDRRLFILLAKLTGMTFPEARRATGEGRAIPVRRGDLKGIVDALEDPDRQLAPRPGTELQLAKEFRRMSSRHGAYAAESRFSKYLVNDRGFERRDIRRFVRMYKLHYCVKGDFADRIIIPVYEDEKLMTYLGRSIFKNSSLRYRALDKEFSVKQVKDCVFNYDNAKKGGKFLFIVEGALDAMKVDFYGHSKDIRAVGLFNINVEDSQVALLYNLRGLFDHYIILLDKGETGKSIYVEQRLKRCFGVDVNSMFLRGFDDPAELSPQLVRTLGSRFLKRGKQNDNHDSE